MLKSKLKLKKIFQKKKPIYSIYKYNKTKHQKSFIGYLNTKKNKQHIHFFNLISFSKLGSNYSKKLIFIILSNIKKLLNNKLI